MRKRKYCASLHCNLPAYGSRHGRFEGHDTPRAAAPGIRPVHGHCHGRVRVRARYERTAQEDRLRSGLVCRPGPLAAPEPVRIDRHRQAVRVEVAVLLSAAGRGADRAAGVGKRLRCPGVVRRPVRWRSGLARHSRWLGTDSAVPQHVISRIDPARAMVSVADRRPVGAGAQLGGPGQAQLGRCDHRVIEHESQAGGRSSSAAAA